MTILVRLALWPLVNKQLHSQRALQKLAPEAAKVKAKAKGDKQLESKLLMELYKERQINPFSSLLPLIVQLPILIALFVVIRDIVKAGEIARLSYDSVKSLPYIKDVIAGHPAFNATLLGLVDLAKPNLALAVIAGATQFLQAKQLMPAKSDDPNAKALAATSYLFPFLTIFIAMSLPSALALFWAVTSLVALVQQGMVLRHDAKDLGAGDAK
jgi:YidC/Oxa1 family membrane protein insertase